MIKKILFLSVLSVIVSTSSIKLITGAHFNELSAETLLAELFMLASFFSFYSITYTVFYFDKEYEKMDLPDRLRYLAGYKKNWLW